MAEPVDIAIRDDHIRLGQLLKLADLVDSGSDVKTVVAAGEVSVNGASETRRGAQLSIGDIVSCGDAQVRIVREAGPE